MPEAWNPDQYLRFQTEREQPFWDLLALVRKKPGMRVCDLGCGTGALTAKLHQELQARENRDRLFRRAAGLLLSDLGLAIRPASI